MGLDTTQLMDRISLLYRFVGLLRYSTGKVSICYVKALFQGQFLWDPHGFFFLASSGLSWGDSFAVFSNGVSELFSVMEDD